MPKPALPKTKVADDLAQLQALRSRLRGRICDAVYHNGRQTVHDLAEYLGVPVTTLYPHLDQLVSVGLLLEGDAVRAGRTKARTYVAPARRLVHAYESEDAQVRDAIADVISSQLRLADREFRSAMESGESAGASRRSRLSSTSAAGWLTETDIRELNRLIGEIANLFEGTAPGRGRRPHAITLVSRPVG